MYPKTFTRLACLLFVVCSSSLASAQQLPGNKRSPARSVTYGFVSPNTREGLKLEDAIRHLKSPEEESLIRQTPNLACVAQSPIQTARAIGSWSDGAEHSVILRARSDNSTMRYLLARLGRDNNQKAVLHFQTSAEGGATIYILRPGRYRGLRALSDTLDRAGIVFRTLVPQRGSALVYVVDLKRELQSKISLAARRLRARVTARRGSAEFIGDDSNREKAKAVFDETIRGYEVKNSTLIDRCKNQTTRL